MLFWYLVKSYFSAVRVCYSSLRTTDKSLFTAFQKHTAIYNRSPCTPTNEVDDKFEGFVLLLVLVLLGLLNRGIGHVDRGVYFSKIWIFGWFATKIWWFIEIKREYKGEGELKKKQCKMENFNCTLGEKYIIFGYGGGIKILYLGKIYNPACGSRSMDPDHFGILV